MSGQSGRVERTSPLRMSAVHWKVVVSRRGAYLPVPAAFDVGPYAVLVAVGFVGDRWPAAESERVRPRVAFGPAAHAGAERVQFDDLGLGCHVSPTRHANAHPGPALNWDSPCEVLRWG